jgi:hypothetical protein
MLTLLLESEDLRASLSRGVRKYTRIVLDLLLAGDQS